MKTYGQMDGDLVDVCVCNNVEPGDLIARVGGYSTVDLVTDNGGKTYEVWVEEESGHYHGIGDDEMDWLVHQLWCVGLDAELE